MNAVLIKIFATALALSQVTTKPDAIKSQFDPATDRDAVVQLLRDGCAHMRKAFDIEDINLDSLITTAMDDPKAVTGDVQAFKGINFGDLHIAYRQFCKNETVPNSPFDASEVIAFYNKAMADLPPDSRLKSLRLAGGFAVLDGKGARYAEIYPEHRRMWVSLRDIPDQVQKAFVTAEDKRFYQHKGIDERGLIRAFITNLAEPGRPQGGSTITQQVAKNLVVGDDVTYERKMREMIVASRLESLLSKSDILELYLNSIYLGRGAWGIELAARSFFGKSAKDLTLAEGAQLAGLAKGPNYFNPERHPDRARERLMYVLGRMQADGVIGAADSKRAETELLKLVAYEPVRRDSGFYFVDQIPREAKTIGLEGLTPETYTVHSTIRPDLQRATETALQDGLARFEASNGRAKFQGAEINLAEAVKKLEAERVPGKPAWQQALETTRLPLYDVHWTPAIVVPGRKGEGIKVGLTDGRVLPLAIGGSVRKALSPYDVVYVRVGQGKTVRAELRIRPEVQGAIVVLDNATGAILAVAGGFSYPLSQLNRATQSVRQPGSTFKPFTYLAALRKGLQPNTMVRDQEITLPPINGSVLNTPNIIADPFLQNKDYWTPKNYGGGSSGVITLRRALENSKNLVTANLLEGGIELSAPDSLQRVCDLALEAQLYKECMPYYPFVLGAQPARLVDLAAFYAAIANEGARPSPHVIESVEQGGRTVYRHNGATTWLGSADRVAFYQLKSILQGVVARGTANGIKQLAPYVAGKTGTSDDENDALFVGFSNEVTVAVWVGYDNADGKRRTLGRGATGGKVAVPIFEPVMQAVWQNYAPRTALAPPSADARRQLVAVPINYYTGDPLGAQTPGAFTEYMRLDRTGSLNDTQYDLVSRAEAETARYYQGGGYDGEDSGYYRDGYIRGYGSGYGQPGYYGRPGYYPPSGYVPPGYVQAPRPPAPLFGLFGNQQWYEQQQQPAPRTRRVDPDYFFGRRQYY
jgi:membrane carboxypeptidase/penicillin-binding protein